MILKVFAIHDRQLNAFMQPFFAPSAGAATRGFRDLVNEQGHQLNKHPEDYALYQICNWSDDDGIFYHDEKDTGKPIQIALAVNLIERKN